MSGAAGSAGTAADAGTATATATASDAATSAAAAAAAGIAPVAGSGSGDSGSGGGAGTVNVIDEFKRQLESGRPLQVSAVSALTEVVRRSDERTAHGLLIELKAAADALKQCPKELLRGKTHVSVQAACELLVRFVTRTSKFNDLDFDDFRRILVERGETFVDVSSRAKATVADLGRGFIRDGAVVMTHGYSQVVEIILTRAADAGKHFSVVVTEGRPDNAGERMATTLSEHGIPVTLVLDSATAYVMERVDLVVVGAEGVVENGGIISHIGTYQTAIVASALKTPFYAAAESYKFARLFPLSQKEVQERLDAKLTLPGVTVPDSVEIDSPSCDYTPPQFITLLFTDLGVLTPSAVSDELIKLYA